MWFYVCVRVSIQNSALDINGEEYQHNTCQYEGPCVTTSSTHDATVTH